jgi:predicted nucleotidyltransferase
MPFADAVPPDLEERLAGIGQVIVDAVADVNFAYLFGSTATGRRTPRSDVDLAIHFGEQADRHSARLDVARAVADQLGTDAIDIVVLNDAPIALAGRILTTRRVVVDRRPFARHRYESLTARMFQDFRLREHRILAARYPRG